LTKTLSHRTPDQGAPFKLLIVAMAVVALAGCSSLAPAPLSSQSLAPANQADRQAIREGVEPLTGVLTLDEAMARALKHNLDRRARMMEEALAMKQLDVSKFDMLPKMLASAGYNWRSNDLISESRNSENGDLSPSTFISQERKHGVAGLDLSWSLIDLGLGYYGSTQQADRVLIAGERRRKAMHLLMQDVRTAYWRALAAQKLRHQVSGAIALAEEALSDSRTAEAERVRSPLDALRYQRQLLENLRLLEAISQELSSAQIELASLINLPLGQPIVVADQASDAKPVDDGALKLPIETLEEAVLSNNADLRETHYNARIARIETRRTLARLMPNVTLNAGTKYDSDSYLVNPNWQEAGVVVSFNLFNLFTGPTQMKLADAGVALADQRRMAMQLGVLTQMHLARMSLMNARAQFERADAIFGVDNKIADMVKNREASQAQSKLDSVSNATTAILSLLRRYQALAQVHSAESKLIANLGLEPQIGSVSELSLAQLTEQVGRESNPWVALQAAPKATQAAQPNQP
jgi:outer membrane protein TolC